MNKQSGIYRIVNTVNDCTYIGSSINTAKRLRRHRIALDRGDQGNAHLQNAWIKYGHQAFIFESLIECERSELAKREQDFIDAYFEHGLPLYNQKPSHESRKGFPYSKDTLNRMSKASSGRCHTMETRQRISASLKRYLASQDGRLQRREAMLGHIVSSEARRKMAVAAHRRKHSAETRAKIGQLSAARRPSLATRAKMSASITKAYASAEARQRMSRIARGIIWSAERRRRQSVVMMGNIRGRRVNSMDERVPQNRGRSPMR